MNAHGRQYSLPGLFLNSFSSWSVRVRRSILPIILCMFSLTSCTHVSHRDGAPNFYVDETKIPNAKPKPEKLAKYGNMKFYHVAGKRYYTMKSSRHYEATGIASWYGTLFHEHKTSSGERYDMLGMTAAHKTLPLPTYVEVTNLKNNRKIVVKVNDRGPFAEGRIIDLSYVAAKKLGMLGRGTAHVKVKAIDPLHYGHTFEMARKSHKSIHPKVESMWDSVSVANDTGGRSVYLQVGAFRSRMNAEKLQHRLTALLEAPVKISNPNAQGSLYRVHIGPIKDTAAAEQITQRLQDMGIKSNKHPGA